MVMIHIDMDSCKRPRLNRWIVLNRSWESSSIDQCLQWATPPFINFFPHSVVGLNGDVATTTTLQKVGSYLPTNVSALDRHLLTTELAVTNLIILPIQ